MTAPLGEFGRIAAILRPLAEGLPGALGLADDAGLIPPVPGHDLVATTDAMVEGVHWLPGTAPGLIARKLLRVNLSDLAAMGARPHAYLLTTALPAAFDDAWLAAFAAGLAEDQERFAIRLLGGDSVRTQGPPVLCIAAFGHVPSGRALRRSGARPGDGLWVSGTLGDAALGLAAARGALAGVEAGNRRWLEGRHHLPEPRVALGQGLIGIAHAAMDISDGLAGDLPHLCRASAVGAVVEAGLLPRSPAAAAALAAHPDLEPTLLAGGDDYELLFAAPAKAVAALRELAGETGVVLTSIGEVVAGTGVEIRGADARPIQGLAGWRHF